eukprot:1559023-Rhodomonas_salina.1
MKAPGFYFPTNHTPYCPGERVSISLPRFFPFRVAGSGLAQPHAQRRLLPQPPILHSFLQFH